MAIIEIPKWRQESTVLLHVKLKDNGVAVDWSGLQNVKAYMYSDSQRIIAGKCDVEVDGSDGTVLNVTYPATKPQYLGVNSLLVRCKYYGREKSYDVPVGEFVERTAQATGVTVIEDPEMDVEIEVDEVSTSLLDGAIAAALDAAVKAEEAASLVPLQVLEDCVEATENAETATAAANEAAAAASAAGITSVQASVADNEPGTPSVDAALLNKVLSLVFHHLKGAKGDTGATPNISVGTVTTGASGTPVVITMTGTAEAPVLNITIPQGLKGEKGDQGNTGSSVEFPYELVNNLTTNDATKGLSAAQGVVLDGKISQLDQKVNNVFIGATNSRNVAINTAGVENDSDITVTTDFMELKSTSVPVNVSGNVPDGYYIGARIVFFAADKTVTDYWGNYTGNAMPKTYNAPAGSKYVRLSIRLINSSTSTAAEITPSSVEVYKVNFPAKIVPTYNEFAEVRQNVEKLDDAAFVYKLSSANTALEAIQTNGSVDMSNITVRSNYIPIKGNSIEFKVKGTVSGTLGYRLAVYDKNFVYLDYFGSYSGVQIPKVFTNLPSGTKYVRICLRNLVNGTAQTLTPTSIDSWGVVCDGLNMADSDSVLAASGNSTAILSLNDRRFYGPAIANLKRQRRLANGTAATPPPLTLLQFTDLHGNFNNIARLAKFKSAYAAYIDDVIHLGDGVYNTIADDFTFWGADEYASFLNVIGNHDSASGGGVASAKDVYDKFISPFVSGWSVEQPEGALDGLCYYYKDYATQAVRLIVCDSTHWDANQKTWLGETLAAAESAGYSVILAQHYPLSVEQANFVECNFTSYKTSIIVDGEIPSDILDAVDTFIAAGGKFVCHINGHSHCDIISYTKGTTYKQLSITTDTATNELPQWNDGDRTTGTKSQDAFNIVGFDTYSQTVRIVKVGKNINQALQNALYIAIRYDETGVSVPEILGQS